MEEDKITEEQYLIGESNGISRRNVYRRWDYGWDIERAISEPVRKRDTGWSKWKEVAKEHGIYCSMYYNRIKAGLTHEQAATTPINKNGGDSKKRKWKVGE